MPFLQRAAPVRRPNRARQHLCAAAVVASAATVFVYVHCPLPLQAAEASSRRPTVLSMEEAGEGLALALQRAVREGDAAEVEQLLMEFPEIVDAEGTALLTIAAGRGYSRILEILLAAGAEPNPLVRGARTPLYAAAQGGHSEAVQFLLAYGADVNPLDAFVPPPLCGAAGAGQREVTKILLDAGAAVDPGSTGGWSPLYPAAR
ncbi:MAG: ankyrin repeat domain-containing protein, partial [Planctomycetota bacterium]